MNAQKIGELVQTYDFLQRDFNWVTDEIIYYDIDEEVMHAYGHTGQLDWYEVFAMTDCYHRWGEVAHPADGNIVERFLDELKQGHKYAEMNCRFQKKGSYYWYNVWLKVVAKDSNSHIALGKRRGLEISSDCNSGEHVEGMDSTIMVYTESAWKNKLESLIWKYEEQQGMLAIVDFNEFRGINEQFGYRVGDLLLYELIDNIRNSLSQAALIGRLGADIFGIYINDVADKRNWLQQLQEALFRMKHRYLHDAVGKALLFSVGVAFFPQNASNYQELIERAREAWVYSKLSKCNEICLYKEGMLRYVWEKYLGKDWTKSSSFDTLTGLYRIEDFKEHTKKILKKKRDKQYVLVYSDICNFKYVNATFGYEIGDRVLVSWAGILKNEEPNVLFAGRDGEDQFVSLREMDGGLSETEILLALDEAKQMVEQQMKMRFKGSNFTLSTGAYCLRKDEEDLSAAIACANMARKKARNSSTNCELYTDRMRQEENEATEMVASLDEAIAHQEFCVYLQPKVACRTEKVVGAEALVRWMRKGQQLVYPDKFINTFEKYGCIIKLDYCVYEQVFRLLRKWLDEGNPVIPISLNVSRVHFRNTELIEKIEELMQIYRIPTQAIEFEITESMYRETLPALEEIMQYFHQKGFKVSMDDFGADGSCLNALSTIPVDVVKMDKVFMKRGGLEGADKILIKNVIHMANELHKEVLCEGVETKEQKEFIASVGCDIWQGYLCSKPIPIKEFEELLAKSDFQGVGC